LHAEWLRQVVIGTEVQPFDAILYGVSGAQDQDRFVEAGLAPLLQKPEAVAVRQSQIEDDGVMAGLAERVAGLAAGPRPGHRIGAVQKRLLEEGPDAVLIFDNEYFRRSPPAAMLPRCRPGAHTGPGDESQFTSHAAPGEIPGPGSRARAA